MIQKEGEELKGMFEGGSGENIEAIAGKLLECFMNKELLYAPLIECRDSYNSFFEKQKGEGGKVEEKEMTRFKQQYKVIDQIITTLDNDPDNKEKLMQLFEEMQEYGQPPAGIASVTLPGGM